MKILKNLLVFLTYFIAVATAFSLIYLSTRSLLSNVAFSDSIQFATTPDSEVAIRSALIAIFTAFLPFNLAIRAFIFIVRKISKKSAVSEVVHLFSAFFATITVVLIAQPIIFADYHNLLPNRLLGTFSQFTEFLRFGVYMFIGSLILTILNLLIKFVRSLG